MVDDAPFRADGDEALGLWTRPLPPPPDHPDLRTLCFEYSSRGDRVPGRLLLPPEDSGSAPLVLLQHGPCGSDEARDLDTTRGTWALAGAAVASIDFPLHGERADAKLMETLGGGFGPGTSPAAQTLGFEFARQAVIDLRRALDAAAKLPGVDASRSVYAGFGLGALVGAIFCGVDPRPRAAALGGGGLGPLGANPADFVAGAAGRPLLFAGATGDETIPRAATEALFAAAGDPKELRWLDVTQRELPGAALETIWSFLRGSLFD